MLTFYTQQVSSTTPFVSSCPIGCGSGNMCEKILGPNGCILWWPLGAACPCIHQDFISKVCGCFLAFEGVQERFCVVGMLSGAQGGCGICGYGVWSVLCWLANFGVWWYVVVLWVSPKLVGAMVGWLFVWCFFFFVGSKMGQELLTSASVLICKAR